MHNGKVGKRQKEKVIGMLVKNKFHLVREKGVTKNKSELFFLEPTKMERVYFYGMKKVYMNS